MADAPAPVAHRVLTAARRLFMPVALLGLGWAGYEARGEFSEMFRSARPGPLLVAVVAWASLNLVVPGIAYAWLRGLEASPGYRTLLRIHLARLPARYLPGGIWHTVARYVDLSALGTGRTRLAALALLENVAPPAIALALGAACLSLTGRYPPAAVLAALLVSAGLALSPFVVLRLWMRSLPTIPLARSVRAFLGLLLFWLIASFAFASYWSAFPPGQTVAAPAEVIGAYLTGWAVGFAALFAPQGIGVFEATVAWMLRDALPFSSLVILVAGFRAAMIAGDALAYLASLAWRGDPIRGTRDEH